ncbi:MAG: hypothetical protein JKX83_02790 [Pseudomonadales bacterium]|nr:hypothetical protein [Pseudomonadales bacterium]
MLKKTTLCWLVLASMASAFEVYAQDEITSITPSVAQVAETVETTVELTNDKPVVSDGEAMVESVVVTEEANVKKPTQLDALITDTAELIETNTTPTTSTVYVNAAVLAEVVAELEEVVSEDIAAKPAPIKLVTTSPKYPIEPRPTLKTQPDTAALLQLKPEEITTIPVPVIVSDAAPPSPAEPLDLTVFPSNTSLEMANQEVETTKELSNAAIIFPCSFLGPPKSQQRIIESIVESIQKLRDKRQQLVNKITAFNGLYATGDLTSELGGGKYGYSLGLEWEIFDQGFYESKRDTEKTKLQRNLRYLKLIILKKELQ